MRMPWYYIIIYIVIGSLLLWISDRFRFIKSRSLRYFVVSLVYSFVWWVVYDNFLSPS